MTVTTIPTWLEPPVLSASPLALASIRKQHWDAFAAHGLPTRQAERWKYADLGFLTSKTFVAAKQDETTNLREAIDRYRLTHSNSTLAVFVNGHFAPQWSDLAALPEDVTALSLKDAWEQHADIVTAHKPKEICAKKYPFAALNAASFVDGLFLLIPDDVAVEAPIHLLSITTDVNVSISQPHHILLVGTNSSVTIFEESMSLTQETHLTNRLMTLVAADNAQVDYYKLQHDGIEANQLTTFFIEQHDDSRVALTYVSAGSQFSRDEVVINLQGVRATCSTVGFYRTNQANQFVDHHIEVNHLAPHSQSEMLYKGIVDNKSRSVFNGRLYVEKGAEKILAYQGNHNLLLSSQAEVYSKPELEIYADDVKCKHGATTGQLDQEALFYLQARGIAKADAITMLLSGFAEDILKRIQHPGIKAKAEKMVQA